MEPKVRTPITPEAGFLTLVAAIGGTFAICFISEEVFGKENGIYPAFLLSFFLGRYARRFAEWLSNCDK